MDRNTTVLAMVISILFVILVMAIFGPPDRITENAIFTLAGALGGAFAVMENGSKKKKGDDE